MAKVTMRFSKGQTTPRKKILRELAERLDINESIESLVAQMHAYEAKYGMSTLEFYARFAAGKMGDSRDFLDWAGAFEDYHYLIETHFQRRRRAA